MSGLTKSGLTESGPTADVSVAAAGRAKTFDRERLRGLADILAVALVVSLPWSTSATGILAVLWLVALVPTLDVAAVRRELLTPSGGLPVLLWMLGLVGMLWAFDVPLKERLGGLSSYHKLLLIPLLIAQFRRSERASWAMAGFIASCSVLMALSYAGLAIPKFPFPMKTYGIPVKDYIAQGAEFSVCIFFLMAIVQDRWRQGRRIMAIALSVLAVLFLLNIFLALSSRTTLVVIPLLLAIFAIRQLSWMTAAALMIAGLLLGAAGLSMAPNLRSNIVNLIGEIRHFDPDGGKTRAGERLVFWAKSVGFVMKAPLIGHGTGSIRGQFRQSVDGRTGMAAEVTPNPHNQTLAVAVQLGLIGTVVLFAMWIAHVLVFRSTGLIAWAGLVVVLQNVVGSLFNSHLFDFTHGWGYVLGVGIAAGSLRRRDIAPAAGSPGGHDSVATPATDPTAAR